MELYPKDYRHYRLERELLSAVRLRLEKAGAVVIHVHGEPYQQRAVDIIACLSNGKFFAAELKIRPNKPTATQLNFLQRIQKSNGIAVVAYTVADCLMAINEIEEETQ